MGHHIFGGGFGSLEGTAINSGELNACEGLAGGNGIGDAFIGQDRVVAASLDSSLTVVTALPVTQNDDASSQGFVLPVDRLLHSNSSRRRIPEPQKKRDIDGKEPNQYEQI